MLATLRNYDVQESSLMRNMADARKKLTAAHPEITPMVLFLFEYDLDRLREDVRDSNILVIYNSGPSNPFEPSTRKVYRIVSFRVEFKNLENREHIHVINALREQFKPGLSYPLWDPQGSDDVADYVPVTPGYIQDMRDGNGYPGNDGRYVIPFSLDLKFPRVIN